MFAAVALLALSSIEVRVHSENCGSLTEVRDEVRTRLGRDPDQMGSQTRFEVEVARKGALLEAKLVTTNGTVTSSRTFSSSDCRELIGSVGLAISISLDPTLLLEPDRPPLAATAPPPSPLAPAPPDAPTQLSVAPVIAAAAGVSGLVTFSGGVSVGLLHRPWWIAVEGRVEVPVTFTSGVSAFATLGTLSPGWQFGWLRLSVPLSIGALLVTGGGSSPVRDSRLVVLAGAPIFVSPDAGG